LECLWVVADGVGMGTSPRSSEFQDQLRRVRQEYLDTPNLQLSPSGLQRLFGLRPAQCAEILEAMLGEDFLRRTSDGLFVRARSPQPDAAGKVHSVNDADPL
jgi:hypothetical protein